MTAPASGAAHPSTLRFLALGDSYTIGEAVTPSERWTHRLAGLLRERGVDIADPVTIARTGWTSGELLAAIDAAAPANTFDLVTVLIGVNDQYRECTLENYRSNLDIVLQRAEALAGGRARRVLVVSIPDWGVTPFASGRNRVRIAREIDAFNAANEEAAARIGSRYVDVTVVARRAVHEPALVASDGLHPSGAMYAEWARLALPAALEAVGVARG